jgi:hypothetical protein
MLTIMLLILVVDGNRPVTEQIQFRTIESCQIAEQKIELELAHLNAHAICLDRSKLSD